MNRWQKDYDFSHEFYCCKCGNKGFNIARRKSSNRAGGHLKKLFCLTCKTEVNFCECNNKYTHNDFLIEFNLGNFDINQNRIQEYGEFKNTHQKEIEAICDKC